MEKLSEQYPIWFCDVWGVIHNGFISHDAATQALIQHRNAGGIVVLVTNSPRTSKGVARQLAEIAVPNECYDAIVTSGDVTQTLMASHARGKVYHLGPTRDLSIFEGTSVERVSLLHANAVLCTGLVNDEVETPDDYGQILEHAKALNLAMICANPDKVVRKGDKLLYCAGALAEKYSAMGGSVLMAGKPYAPIYELAYKLATDQAKLEVPKYRILAIGDGPETDIKGATDFGCDVVLIAGGVTDASKGLAAAEALVQRLVPQARIRKTLDHLAWD